MLKVGISSCKWYLDDQPLESLSTIRDSGFEAIDFNLSPYFSTTTANKEGIYPNLFDQSTEQILSFFEPLKEALKATGITISQIHAPYPGWFEGNDALNGYLQMVMDKAFAVCQYLGCPAIVVHPVEGKTSEEEWAFNHAIYQSMIPLVKKYPGVKCCLENLFVHHKGRIIEGRLANADEICRLCDLLNEECGDDCFGICFDVGHAILTGQNIKEYLKKLGHRLTILHIHDNNGQADQHLMPYSCVTNNKRDTVCDWEEFVQGLREISYRGVLSFETDLCLKIYPLAVRTEVLRLISAIGHHWAAEIEA